METEWSGRYKPLISALVKHANSINRSSSTKIDYGDGVMLYRNEWQVFEKIIENDDETFNMLYISECLGIPQSSFSRIVKDLCNYKLVEKYKTVNNRKNIILKPTEYGRKFYENRINNFSSDAFRSFFEILQDVPDDMLETVTRAIEELNHSISNSGNQEVELVKVE